MPALNLDFIYTNVLRTAKLRIPINTMFSEDLVKIIEAWEPLLGIDSLSSAILDIFVCIRRF